MPPNNRARRYAAAALSLLCATGALGAQKHDLEKVEAQIVREREKQKALDANSRRLALAAARLRREMIDTARSAQEKEAILTRLEKQLVILVAEAADR